MARLQAKPSRSVRHSFPRQSLQTFLFALVLTNQVSAQQKQPTCWWKSQNRLLSASNDGPCGTNYGSALSCCSSGDVCLGNQICHGPNGSHENGSGYYLAGCTDKSLKNATVCTTHCQAQKWPDIVYDSTTKKWACCKGNGNGGIDCTEPTAENWAGPDPAALLATAKFTAHSSTASVIKTTATSATGIKAESTSISVSTIMWSTSTTSSTTSDTATTTSPTSTPTSLPTDTTDNDPPSTPIGAIVGSVVGGIAGIALIAVLTTFIIRSRRQKQQASKAALGTSRPPKWAEGSHGEGEVGSSLLGGVPTSRNGSFTDLQSPTAYGGLVRPPTASRGASGNYNFTEDTSPTRSIGRHHASDSVPFSPESPLAPGFARGGILGTSSPASPHPAMQQGIYGHYAPVIGGYTAVQQEGIAEMAGSQLEPVELRGRVTPEVPLSLVRSGSGGGGGGGEKKDEALGDKKGPTQRYG